MAQDATPTQRQMDTLRGLIRCGSPLTGEQRDHLAQLLDAVGAGVLAAREIDAMYTRLLETVLR